MSSRAPAVRIKQEEAEDKGPNHPAHAQLTTNGASFLVPVPQLGEGIETTFNKVHGLANAVGNGGVLAFNNAQASVPIPSPEAEALAKKHMTAQERSEYAEWKANKIRPPIFDFAVNQARVPPEGLKTFTLRAAAMDVIWQREGTLPAHASWFSSSMKDWVPLVKAVEKVLKAQTQLDQEGGSAGLTASQMAELETLRQINGTIDENVTRALKQIEAILESADVLKWRQKALERSLPLS